MVATEKFENASIEETLERIGRGTGDIDSFKNMGIQLEKIKCPHCGYEMPITKTKDAESKGLFVRCKGRNCKREFEIKIVK